MAKVHLYGLNTDGVAVPVRVDSSGNLGGGSQSNRPWSYAAASGGITGTSDVALTAAAGAGISNYIETLTVQNSHATTSTEVVLKDGSTVIWRGYARAANANDLQIRFSPPLYGTPNTALNVACITNTTATYVNAQGFKARPPSYFEETHVTTGEELYDDNGVQLTDSGGNLLFL